MKNIELEEMILAAEKILGYQELLAESGKNIVSELLNFAEFKEWDHHPEGDARDEETGAQYFYHAHPNSNRGFSEHGHFHIFQRNNDKPAEDKLQLTHIIAVSMDYYGKPQGLFTVNHWVTGGVWEDYTKTCTFLDSFELKAQKPSIEVNKWVSAILKLYKPQIKKLIEERDKKIEEHKRLHPDVNTYEDKSLEITSYLPISIEVKLVELLSLCE